jgi:hypothetical protein
MVTIKYISVVALVVLLASNTATAMPRITSEDVLKHSDFKEGSIGYKPSTQNRIVGSESSTKDHVVGYESNTRNHITGFLRRPRNPNIGYIQPALPPTY